MERGGEARGGEGRDLDLAWFPLALGRSWGTQEPPWGITLYR